MENLEQKIKRESFKSGLVLGGILLALGILTFYFITVLTNSVWLILSGPIIFSVLVPIILVVFLCISIRKRIGGYWSFKQATTGVFIMFIMAYAIQTIGRDLIFAKIIEPDMVVKTQKSVMRATTGMLEKSGADQTHIDAKLDEIQKQFDDEKNVPVSKIVEGIVISVILIFAFALIFGAIFKKDPPLFAPASDQEAQ